VGCFGTKAFTNLVGHGGVMKKVPEFGTVESFPVWTKGFTLLVQPIALKKMPEHSKTLLAPSQLGRPGRWALAVVESKSDP
jgi:hypothetical protein